MNLFETHYSRWDGKHTSIWTRRYHIAAHGMRAAIKGKLMKWLIGTAWSMSFCITTILFLISQVIQPDSFLQNLGDMNKEIGTVVGSITAWLNDNPDISISSLFNVAFFLYTWFLSFLSVVVVTKAIPHLMTQDIASKSLIIYTSKAINKMDYFLGKLGAIIGVFMVIWIIPCIVTWLAVNAFAPEWHFFYYSASALWHSLIFLGINTLVVSFMAMGFSSISGNPRVTTGVWLAYWILGGVLENLSRLSPTYLGWLKYTSYQYDLGKIQMDVFNLNNYYQKLVEMFPGLQNSWLGGFLSPDSTQVSDSYTWLVILSIVSIVMVFRKLDTESQS